MRRSQQITTDANSSSMADIAFLLLIFFMITTTIISDKGLDIQLPTDLKNQQAIKFKERNIFNILVNSNDELLVEGQILDNHVLLKHKIKKHILNQGTNPQLSESPEKAIISIKTNRGTTQKAFIAVLDQTKGAYYEIYSQKTGLDQKVVREQNFQSLSEKQQLIKVKTLIPMNISIAEPQY